MAHGKSLTVIHFSSCELKENSAATIHAREIVINLRNLGFTVEIIARKATRALSEELKPVIVPFIPIKGFRTITFTFLANCYLFSLSRKFASAVIYCRRVLLDPFPALVSKLSGAPLILELNETIEPHIKELWPYWFWKIALNVIEKILFHQSHAVLCPSETMCNYYKERYPNEKSKFHIVFHGVNLDKFKPVNRMEAQKELAIPGGSYILWAGTGFWWSGLQFLFELGSELKKMNSRTKILIIGEGKEVNDLKISVEKKDMADYFFFLPHVPYDRMPLVYSSAFLLLAPYDRSLLTVRGFPFKIVESLACATPVVTLKAPVSEEINALTSGLALIDAYDAGKWCNEIEGLLSNPEKLRLMGEHSREALVKNNITWLSAAERTAAILRKER